MVFFVVRVVAGKGLERFGVRAAKEPLVDAPEVALGGLYSPFMPRAVQRCARRRRRV